MNNMLIYDATRSVPAAAQKEIVGGRLKGKTDINPMWRIKTLTEQFGIAGIGWKAPIKRTWLEAGANDEIACFCEIELFVKVDGAWSEGIQGTGGSMFVASEKNGMYTSDEAFKMAYTDAISVACKALGFGADVYWNGDSTKYTKGDRSGQNTAEPAETKSYPPSAPRTAPEQKKTATLKDAYMVKTKSGRTYGELSEEFLQKIIDNEQTNDYYRACAKMVLEDKKRAFEEIPPGEEDLPF